MILGSGFCMAIAKKNRALVDDAHHVARYLKPKFLIRDALDEKIIGVYGQAFKLRSGEEFLSANWIEYFELPKLDALKNIVSGMKASKLSVSSKGALAVANIANIKSIGKDRKSKIGVEYRPTQGNKSHSGIFNTLNEDTEMLDLLSREAFSELVQIEKLVMLKPVGF